MTPRRPRDAPPPSPIIDLLVAVLWRVPRLPGAACRDHVEIFDEANGAGWGRRPAEALRQARAAAKSICAHCPAAIPCGQWVDGLRPSERPGGVVAGKIARPPIATKISAAQQYSTTERKPT
ncbi:MAG: hypothetical protein WBB00_20425 [Mycobacterium sp.]